jgi:hypothetical protein
LLLPSATALGQEPERKYAAEFHHLFTGAPPKADDLKKVGPENDQRVQFAADGLRINLPAGVAKTRAGIGILSGFGVRGDFEITVRYEILQEPEPKDAGPQTRFAVTLRLDRPNPDQFMANINRRVAEKEGTQYVAWLNLAPGDAGKRHMRVAATKAKSGQLRLVRTGPDLAYLVSEGDEATFKEVATFPLGADDLKDVRVIGFLGGEKASLDVRVHELHIRADGFIRPTPKVAEEIVVPQKDYAQEYYHSFKGNPKKPAGWDYHGPANLETVRFESEGLHLALPDGWNGERPGTGIETKFGVHGDFEITMSYEILKAPEPIEAAKPGTRISMAIVKDTPHKGTNQSEVATINRTFTAKGGHLFVTWMRLGPDANLPKNPTARTYPMKAIKGKFRFVRSGGQLYYVRADEGDEGFKAYTKFPFGPEDLWRVELVGSTGFDKATLDARVTDIRIRADGLPNAPVTAPAPPEVVTGASEPGVVQQVADHGWLTTALLIGATVVVLIAIAVGAVVYRRRRSATAPAAVSANATMPSTPAGVTIACTGCGKKLRARSSLAGKKVRCPDCGSTMQIPATTD